MRSGRRGASTDSALERDPSAESDEEIKTSPHSKPPFDLYSWDNPLLKLSNALFCRHSPRICTRAERHVNTEEHFYSDRSLHLDQSGNPIWQKSKPLDSRLNISGMTAQIIQGHYRKSAPYSIFDAFTVCDSTLISTVRTFFPFSGMISLQPFP